MRHHLYRHRSGFSTIQQAVKDEVMSSIRLVNRQENEASNIRKQILHNLYGSGWSTEVRVSPISRITISSMKKKIGLCVQFGNMSRMYADLLKIQHLYLEDHIKAGIMIVPTLDLARNLGSNLVNLERLTDELALFEKTIAVPMLIYGVSKS